MLVDGLEEFPHPIQGKALLFGHADSRTFQKPWTRCSVM